MQNKAGLKFVLCWVGLTFVLGFAWPLVNSLTKRALSGDDEKVANSATPAAPTSNTVAQEATNNTSNQPTSTPTPPVASANPPPAANNSPVPTAAPNNPYAQLMAVQANARKKAQERRQASRSEESTSIGKAFENIHQTGDPSEGTQTKRNAYFQKLEEQLKDLQGKNKKSPRPSKKRNPEFDDDDLEELPEEIEEPMELEGDLDDEDLDSLEDELEDDNLDLPYDQDEAPF